MKGEKVVRKDMGEDIPANRCGGLIMRPNLVTYSGWPITVSVVELLTVSVEISGIGTDG